MGTSRTYGATRWSARLALLSTLALAIAALSLAAAPVANATSGQTVISLTFDNGLASQYGIRSLLSSHGMHGTFFINSDLVGTNSYYMNWSQIRDLAAAGNDIGGQTLDNENLTSVSTTEAQHQVCDDRTALINQGFSATSFAYPYSATNATVEGIVKQCGYSVGRRQGGINDPVECVGCAYSNSIPPADPYNVKGTEWQSQPLALSDLEGWVTRAQANGGGLVPIVFDDICDSCMAASSVSSATLNSFLDWLQQQPNTTVQTMRQVVPPSDTTAPSTTITCNGGSCGGTFQGSASVSLSATDPDSSVSATHYTTDGSVPTASSPTYTGPISLNSSTTIKYRSWDPSGNVEGVQTQYVHVVSHTIVTLTFDDGIATQYQVRAMLAAHGMHGTFFINSGKVGANSYYMTWPQIHDIASDGNEIGGHTVDHYDLTTLTADQVQHEICDDRTALINQGFSVSSFAYPYSHTNPSIDAVVQQCGYAVARRIGGLRDAVDCPNCAVGNSTPLADPFEVYTPVWENRPFTLQDLQGWITQAEDNGGGWVPLVFHDVCDGCANGSVSASDLQAFLDWLQVRSPGTVVKTMNQVVPPSDKAPPTTSISCNGASCGSWYTGAVSVSMSATDPSSTVSSTHYTTDGSDPSATSPTYTGPFTVSSTTTVKFRSWDAAGNVEPTNTQLIQIDGTAPSTTITCAGSACGSGWYHSPVAITLNASDDNSGLASTHYTTDGSTPTLSSPTYTGSFNLSSGATSTITVKFSSWDVAGNAEATHSRQVKVDGSAPATTILCNGGTCSSTKVYARSTKLTLRATDSGSGVASIHYTTDGTTPSLSGSTYTTAFTLPGTRTVSYRAWDKVGNVENTHAIVIHIG